MPRAQIIRYGDIDKRFPERDPESALYQRRVLAEGDSWFTLGAVPSSNILFHIQTPQRTALVTIAEPGDTIVNMGDPDRMLQLRRLIAVPRFAYAWDAILISGGGNDLIESAPLLLRDPGTAGATPEDYVDPGALLALREHVQGAYRNIVDIRDSTESRSQGKPIYVHTYDYPTPRDAPARFLSVGIRGPWLLPAMLLASVPESMWIAVSDHLLDQLAEMILDLDADNGAHPLPAFHVIETRKTLQPARLDTTASDGDWQNETHPNTGGYRKLGAKISAALKI